MSQGSGLGGVLSVLLFQIHDPSRPPLCLSTHTEKSTFASGFRGQQKGQRRLLKPLANPSTEALKLLEKRQLRIVVFQGVSDKMAHIAHPRGPLGGLK